MDRPVQDRLPLSYAAGGAIALLAVAWAVVSARAIDRRAGGLYRSVPTIATAFVAASVVATPASLPLLLIARQRSLEGCPVGTCHFEPILLWVASVAIGTFVIPIAFAYGMGGRARPVPGR